MGADGLVTLRDRRAQHLRKVLAVEVGSEVRVGVVRGALGVGRVVTVEEASVTLALTLETELPVPPNVSLILAMPRPKVLSRVLHTAASMGVAHIDIVNAWRVDKAYWSSDKLNPERMREDLWLGCEQGAGTYLPEVRTHRLLAPYFTEVLPSRVQGADLLLAHPREAAPIETLVHPRRPVVLAIGPEGGWADRELQTFLDLGFRTATLGPFVLKVEAAVAASLAQLDMARRIAAASG